MNDNDKHNLDFLLSADSATLQDWYNKMGPEDHQYADELLKQAKIELTLRELDLGSVEDLSAAAAVLSKYRLN